MEDVIASSAAEGVASGTSPKDVVADGAAKRVIAELVVIWQLGKAPPIAALSPMRSLPAPPSIVSSSPFVAQRSTAYKSASAADMWGTARELTTAIATKGSLMGQEPPTGLMLAAGALRVAPWVILAVDLPTGAVYDNMATQWGTGYDNRIRWWPALSTSGTRVPRRVDPKKRACVDGFTTRSWSSTVER